MSERSARVPSSSSSQHCDVSCVHPCVSPRAHPRTSLIIDACMLSLLILTHHTIPTHIHPPLPPTHPPTHTAPFTHTNPSTCTLLRHAPPRYSALGKLARRVPSRFRNDFDLLERMFRASLVSDERVRSHVRDALAMMKSAFAAPDEVCGIRVVRLLREFVARPESSSRLLAAQYANALFATDHLPSRCVHVSYTCLLFVGCAPDDEATHVLSMSLLSEGLIFFLLFLLRSGVLTFSLHRTTLLHSPPTRTPCFLPSCAHCST